MLRILSIDKTAGLAASHERHQAMAQQPEVELHVLGPRRWIENGRDVIWRPPADLAYTPHFGAVFFKDYYARAGYYSGLCRALHRSQPDVIQLFEEPWSIAAWQTVTAARMLAPQAKILFYTWENIYRPWVYPSRASRLYAFIDKKLHQVSTGAICATHGAKDVLLQKGYRKPIAVIPYGIPDFFFPTGDEPQNPERSFTIGYVGRLLFMKGIDLLSAATAAMPDSRLLLVGSGEEESKFRALAQQLGISDRVEWLPPLAEERIPEILRRMDVFVLPSRRTEGWMEQLGRVAIEAMAVGVPVIGARSGAIPEVLGDAGLVFDENSVDDLIRQITFLRDHPEERRRLRRAGQARSREYFTWSRFAAQICAFYRTLDGVQDVS